MKIAHANCPKKKNPDDQDPEFVWGGFSMAGISDYVCPLCGDGLWVTEDKE